MTALSAVVVAFLGVAAVWSLADVGPINDATFIFSDGISQHEEIQVGADGTYRDFRSSRFVSWDGHADVAPFLEALRNRSDVRLRLPKSTWCVNCLGISIHGSRRSFSTQVSAVDLDISGLRLLSQRLRDQVHTDIARRNAPLLRELASMRELQEVGLFSHDCFGTCGRYEARFMPTHATLAWHERGGGPPRLHRGVAHWSNLIADLRAAHADRLQPAYDPVGVDDWSADVIFRFPDRVFSVHGPGSMAWPPEMWAVVLDLRDAAATATWSPPLDASERRAIHLRRRR